MPYIGAGIQRFNTADGLTVNGTAEVTGASTLTGAVTADAGVSIDNITIDGTEIDLSSGNLTLDVAGDINLDADGGDVNFKDGGTSIGYLSNSSGTLLLGVNTSDADFKVQGNDGGSTINALTLDMSNAGKAAFSAGASFVNSVDVTLNQAAHTNVDIFNSNGDSGARGQLRVGYDSTACLEIYRIGNGAGIYYNSTQGGDHSFQSSGTTKTRFNGNGTIISENVASTAANLEINGASTNGHYNILMNGNSNNGYKVLFKHGTNSVGSIITTNSNTSYATSSDHRLKENVADMTGAIARVKQLSPKRFSWIVDELDAANVDGFIAHEAQTVVPEAVHGTHNQVEVWIEPEVDEEGNIIGEALPDGVSVGDNKLDADGNTIPVYQGIDQSKLVPLLTAALKESITKIETLETEMTALKARVTALEDA